MHIISCLKIIDELYMQIDDRFYSFLRAQSGSIITEKKGEKDAVYVL